MILNRKLSTVSVLIAGLLLLSQCAALAAQTVWVVKGKSHLGGVSFLYTSSSAFKIVNPEVGFHVVTSAPKWDAVFYNDKTKSYYETTFEKSGKDLAGRSCLMRNWLGADTAPEGWRPGPRLTYLGHNVTLYRWSPPQQLSGLRSKHSTRGFVDLVRADCLCLDEADSKSPELKRWRAVLLGYPESGGTPVKLVYVRRHGTEVMFQADSIYKTTLPDQFFSIPAHYRKGASEVDVLAGEEGADAVSDIAKDLGRTP